MKEINLDGNIGDEIALRNGDQTLVVKIAADGIVPDLVSPFMRALATDAYAISLAANRAYHRSLNADELNRATFARVRDKVFASIVAPSEETGAEETEEKAKKRRAKAEA